MKWYIEALKKYAVFSGRSRRREYWFFFLGNFIISVVLAFAEAVLGLFPGSEESILGMIYGLAVLIPGLAVGVRRLHDTDRSGLWLLIGLIPLLGIIVLLVFLVQDSNPGDNRFGPNPKED